MEKTKKLNKKPRRSIKAPHAPYVARKIAIDMLNSNFIKFSSGIEGVAKVAEDILKQDAFKERALDEKVNELLEANSDDMHIMQVDRRDMFWMIKRRLADESGFILAYEDRYAAISHEILETAWKQNLIDYDVSENKAKNIIYQSIAEYSLSFESIEEIVATKLENSTKKLIIGSEEYDLAFEKLYADELKKRGMN